MSEAIQKERFARLRLLLGEEGLERLQKAHVLVLGLGGVGSSCAEALARGGIGHLSLLDGDIVEESNINRQALAFTSTLGMFKTEAMRHMVEEIQPECSVALRQVFLTTDNVSEVLGAFSRPDYVIDCIDTVSQKLAVAQWCAQQRLPLLSAMGAANKLDPTFLQFARIEQTKNCPLSRVIRRECKVRSIGKLEVIYSDEMPVRIHAGESTSKSDTLGSMSYMPPIMGQMMAGKVIRRLLGLEKVRGIPVLLHKEEGKE